ncbi:hypothetical protein D9M73_251770 [compost metagenome]
MHCGLDLIPKQGSLRRLDILEGVVTVIKLGVLCTYIAIWRTSATCHQVVLRRIDGDTVQPRIKRTVAAKISERAVSLDEGFLCYVLGFLGVVHESHDQPEDLVLVLQHQQIESPLVAPLHPFDQLLILFLG